MANGVVDRLWAGAFSTGAGQPDAIVTTSGRITHAGLAGAELLDLVESAAVTAMLQTVSGARRWTIRADQLRLGSVSAVTPGACVYTLPGQPVFITEFAGSGPGDRAIADYLGSGFRKQSRRAMKWLEAHADDVKLERLEGDAAIALLEPIAELRRERDVATNRLGPLSGGALAGPWNSFIIGCAAAGALAVVALWGGGELVAYNLAVRDGETWKVFDGRIRPSQSGASIGRIVDEDMMRWALADPTCRRIVWGRGVNSTKTRLANTTIETVILMAASDRRALVGAFGRSIIRFNLALFRDRHPGINVAWLPLKRLIARASPARPGTSPPSPDRL